MVAEGLGLKVGGGQFGIRCAIRLAMPHSHFMKNLPSFLLLTASVLLPGCSSLENPFGNLFGSGRDARVYNAQTGEYDWPQDSTNPRPAAPAPAAGGAPAPQRRGDGRYFDPVKNEWVDAPMEGGGSSRAASRPSTVQHSATVSQPAPTPMAAPPPPPPPERASGIYNASTGQIEWKDDPSAVPRSTPGSEKKKWYWPF
jgi:hypothetical protein